jgi:protease-4
MKQFFKFMFASMLGTILTFFLMFIVFFIFIASLIALTEKEVVTPASNSVLTLDLQYDIQERSTDDPFSMMMGGEFEYVEKPGLDEILACIKNAASDPKISGILLNSPTVGAAAASTEEIRNALKEFKKSKKFLIAYADLYDQKGYYMATVADKIYMNPEGYFEFKGLNADMMFLKGLMDKLDIEPQIIRHGKFKSAIEPLVQDKASPENKMQMQTLLNSVWGHFVQEIADSRKLPVETLNELAAKIKVQSSKQAFEYKLIDTLMNRDGLEARLNQLLKNKKDEKIDYISLTDYTNSPKSTKVSHAKEKIAVIYADGDITMGEAQDQVTADRFAKAIEKARTDENVKAIVLRVNSPGGMMLAADIILHELMLAAKVKPVVSSFGDYAASGGYYIACASSYIFAQPNTITGSIGVFSVIPNFGNALKNKLGITFDMVKTHENAEYISVTHPLTPYQKEMMQIENDKAYQTFIGYVAKNREITKAQVDSIGQGRVWTGLDAKKIGLVDEIGGIDAAIAKAAELAKIKDYRLMNLPRLKNPLEQVMESLSGKKQQEQVLMNEFGQLYDYYRFLRSCEEYKGVQARLPWLLTIN